MNRRRMLMVVTGIAGLTLFVVANLRPETGYWFGVVQLGVNAAVFVAWLNGFLHGTNWIEKLFGLIGFMVPIVMASITLWRVIL